MWCDDKKDRNLLQKPFLLHILSHNVLHADSIVSASRLHWYDLCKSDGCSIGRCLLRPSVVGVMYLYTCSDEDICCSVMSSCCSFLITTNSPHLSETDICNEVSVFSSWRPASWDLVKLLGGRLFTFLYVSVTKDWNWDNNLSPSDVGLGGALLKGLWKCDVTVLFFWILNSWLIYIISHLIILQF